MRITYVVCLRKRNVKQSYYREAQHIALAFATTPAVISSAKVVLIHFGPIPPPVLLKPFHAILKSPTIWRERFVGIFQYLKLEAKKLLSNFSLGHGKIDFIAKRQVDTANSESFDDLGRAARANHQRPAKRVVADTCRSHGSSPGFQHQRFHLTDCLGETAEHRARDDRVPNIELLYLGYSRNRANVMIIQPMSRMNS